MNNEIGAEMAYLEANKLNQSKAVAIARASREDEQAKEREARGQEAEEKGRQTIPPLKWLYFMYP